MEFDVTVLEDVLIWGGAGLVTLGVLGFVIRVLRAVFGRKAPAEESRREG